MITDQIKNWKQYYSGDAWRAAFEFLESLTPESEDKMYPLRGQDVFGRVMSYTTKSEPDAVLEAHKNFIDIQAIITGREGIGWIPLDTLTVKTPYNPEKDVEFYVHPESLPGQIVLTPGVFTALFPWDAHMPQLTIGSPQPVKKVVVKIRTSLVK